MNQSLTFQAYIYGPNRGPLSLTLERLAEAMQSVPGLYFEWDGSFTWAGRVDPTTQESGEEGKNGQDDHSRPTNGADASSASSDSNVARPARRGLWQISGTIYDNGKIVQYVDLHARAEETAGRDALRLRLVELFALMAEPPSDQPNPPPPGEEKDSTLVSAKSGGSRPVTSSSLSLSRFQQQLQLMRLPDQKWQDLRDFEKEFWPSVS